MSPVRKMRRGVVKPRKRKQDDGVVYIRFGELPVGGRSTLAGIGHDLRFGKTNKGGQAEEKGVSCFEAKRHTDGSLRLVTRGGSHKAGAQRNDFVYLTKADPPRKVYEITGKPVGKGTDGEPILKDCEIVREVPLDVPIHMGPPLDKYWMIVAVWNEWRRLDAERGGERTGYLSGNHLQALETVVPGGNPENLARASRDSKQDKERR